MRDSRAYAEGRAGNPAINPHPVGSSAHAAYAAGAADGGCTGHQGPAECTGSPVAPMRAGSVPRAVPDSTWLKADIQSWLTQEGIDYPADATKAELLLLVP